MVHYLFFFPLSFLSILFGFPICPFRVRNYCISSSFLFVPVPESELPALISIPLQTSAFSFLNYLPVTVTEPETVIGKNPSEHKLITLGPRVTFSNNLRFPSPLSFSESISFSLSVYLPSLGLCFSLLFRKSKLLFFQN